MTNQNTSPLAEILKPACQKHNKRGYMYNNQNN